MYIYSKKTGEIGKNPYVLVRSSEVIVYHLIALITRNNYTVLWKFHREP